MTDRERLQNEIDARIPEVTKKLEEKNVISLEEVIKILDPDHVIFQEPILPLSDFITSDSETGIEVPKFNLKMRSIANV